MARVMNDAGDPIVTLSSDAEAVRWFYDEGRRGDYLDDTGETLHSVAEDLFPHIEVKYDRCGCVVAQERD